VWTKSAQKTLRAPDPSRVIGSKIASDPLTITSSMQALTETPRPAHADADAGAAGRRTLAALPDRAQREASAALARAQYCANLKDTRERRGVRLDALARATKVNESLFVALERGDVSRWPTGIYRRSFFRAYATALGLSPDASLDEFLQLFPDESEPGPPQVGAIAPLRLNLDLTTAPRVRVTRPYLIAAFLDLAIVLFVASTMVWWTQARAATVLAATSLLYYVVATAVFGSSAGVWWLRWRAARKRFKRLRLAR
jgi:transcriptional regulator with XRE-family HTH domain